MNEPKKRGICDTCGKALPLRGDGTIRKHRRSDRLAECVGSGYPPKYTFYDGHMRSTFKARALPEMIEVGGEMIAGPFCIHCGNPLSMHGPESHCPNRILQPVFPPPSCKCHGVDPASMPGGDRRAWEVQV